MSNDPLEPGGALGGKLFEDFLRRLSEAREPEIGEHIGVWKIRSELGRGGSGVVFLADRADGAFHQQVALKWLRGDRPVPGGRAALVRERELLASLDHPHIARLIDGGETEDGMRWFAMDYAAGETIDHHAARLALNDRLRLIATVCRAVHHAHRRGLIHGDIKPSNVLVDERGQPRLVDFGISRLRGSGPGSSYGLTPDYASPEQRRNEPLTTASDIWQLGRLLADMIGDDPAPADLRSIIARAMAEDPDQRYDSAEALAADIEAALERRPVDAHAGGAGYRFVRAVQRNVGLSAVTGLALVIILGGGAWFVGQLADERDTARQQAERAEAALADTAAALARAEALRDFLIGLFRAAEPDRPRDQLPSTEKLLALGARRALHEGSAPPGERVSMLLTLAHVYLTRTFREEARPLLEEAVRLGRRFADQRPEDLARALRLQGYAAMSAQKYERAEQRLAEAESVAAGHERARDAFIAARAHRGWLRLVTGRSQEALGLIEPVFESLDSEAPNDSRGRLRLANTMAFALSSTGHGGRAFEVRQRAVDLSRRIDGPESRGYAIQLGNLGGQAVNRGRLDVAKRSLERAISLYDEIYERPVALRAAARANLADHYLQRGRYQQALETMRASAREWAEVEGRGLEDYEFHHHHRGRLLARMGRWEAAERELARASELFARQERPQPTGPVMAGIFLQRAQCRLGRVESSQVSLDALDQRMNEGGLASPERRAELAESRAICLHRADRPEAALAAIDRSLDAHDAPGAILAAADRLSLKADVLTALDRPEAAARVRETARRRFVHLGLDDHPRLATLRASGAQGD